MADPNPHAGPVFGDLIHGRGNGKRQAMMDSRGGRYTKLPNGREKRGGSRTKGSK